MIEERILSAVERIDGAMTRIEAAAARVTRPVDGPAPDADLRERHETMRARVQSAIAELDGLIARG